MRNDKLSNIIFWNIPCNFFDFEFIFPVASKHVMLAISYTSYPFVSDNCNGVKRQDDLTYNVRYLSFIEN